jgi:two-component system NtrC family response regulator
VKSPTVLVIEDDQVATRRLVDCLKKMRYRVAKCAKAAEVMPAIARHRPSVILLDIKLPDADGIAVLKEIKRAYEAIPVIVVTGFGTVDNAVECMQYGAYDFLTKPFDPTRLEIAVRNALVLHRLQQEADRRPDPGSYSFDEMIGVSPRMQSVYRIISNVARTDATVLITGESGTGKELAARSIHNRSKRARGPFVAVNCAAIPRELLESELFGHEKGSFTGAINQHIGCCESANGGTLFLDEICDMSLDLQAKLLRFLQDRTFQRVGGTETLTADVRLIAATNKDPLKEAEKGNFREDFYYRLMVVPIEMPPLRERAGDSPLLATYFLERFAEQNRKVFTGFSREAMNAILSYPWTGNVRELENVIERVVVLHDGPTVTLAHLPSKIVHYGRQARSYKKEKRHAAPADEAIVTVSEIVREAIRKAVQEANGDISAAARKLDLPEETVREKVEEYGFDRAW